MRKSALIALLVVVLALAGRAWAQPDASSVTVVQAASSQLEQQMANGLKVAWRARSGVAGDMLEVLLENGTSQPVEVSFVAGMVLEPQVAGQQRIILEGGVSVTIPPGGKASRALRAYCLDQGLPAPDSGSDMAYKVTSDVASYVAEIEIVRAGMRLSADKKLKLPLPPVQQRTVDIQRALWARPVGGVPVTRTELENEIRKDAEQAAGSAANPRSTLIVVPPTSTEVQRMSDGLYDDIHMILREALKE